MPHTTCGAVFGRKQPCFSISGQAFNTVLYGESKEALSRERDNFDNLSEEDDV